MEYILIYGIGFAICLVITLMLCRWIFRIDKIVDELETSNYINKRIVYLMQIQLNQQGITDDEIGEFIRKKEGKMMSVNYQPTKSK